MVGQWTQTKGTPRGIAAAALLGAAFALSACVSDEQAVDMGLATKCEADGTVAVLGDPARRFVTKSETEICRGPRRDSYTETRLDIIDCPTQTVLRAGVTRASADQARRGPDYDNTAAVEQARLRLKVGLADLTATESALRAAGVPVSRSAGGAEQCTKLAAGAAQTN
ncbi:hypothetical protein GU927_001110 [Rhodobacteraceae bacterium HSP-20]|uniref:Secreted protein n=1 Tax=Paragemmobacter amnigenus TaxID=2852097 RepID=A0ABS6J200_9RHOB|nr:hypothetical protein [Rhodobacter amnigenus]MBU9696435.1 hypothetical protein [Rhodobacter amnigenus]MBV4387662.1 hypothetical protein [Rhodobacter amnigenus]